MGQKKDNAVLTKLSPVSRKQSKKLKTYREVRDRLIELSGGKSELTKEKSNANSIESCLSCHHITGRAGQKLVNPFNMILLLEREHWIEQANMSWDRKVELLNYIKPIRIRQGFDPQDYESLEWTYNNRYKKVVN